MIYLYYKYTSKPNSLISAKKFSANSPSFFRFKVLSQKVTMVFLPFPYMLNYFSISY